MKPAVGLVATLIVALIGLILFSSSWRSRTQREEARLERVERKRQFLERSTVAKQLGADRSKEWLQEEQAMVRWYFDELAAIQARYPGDKRGPSILADEKDPKRLAELQEWQRYVGERFAMLRDGKYQPRWSGADQGLHLDLLSMNAGKSPTSGEPGLQIDFALWGAPRRVDREPIPGSTRTATRVSVSLGFKQLSFQILDQQGKPHAEMTGTGEPYQKIIDPERFEEDFPPGILFGTWWVERFPREAARTVFQLSVEARGVSGAPLTANYRIEMPVDESWKIGPGESYQAETKTVEPATAPAPKP